MKRVSLYSSSRPKTANEILVPKKIGLKPRFSWKESLRKHRVPLLAAAPGLIALLFVLAQWVVAPAPQQLTQEDVDAAVTNSLETAVLPSLLWFNRIL
jgi:hypothetical protein